MSSFQLNFSSLSVSAKERLARLDAVGGALRSRLLSPSSEAAELRGAALPSDFSSSATVPPGSSGDGFLVAPLPRGVSASSDPGLAPVSAPQGVAAPFGRGVSVAPGGLGAVSSGSVGAGLSGAPLPLGGMAFTIGAAPVPSVSGVLSAEGTAPLGSSLVAPSAASSAVAGVGVSGEFLLAGGVSGGLSAFIVTPGLLAMMCCGAVAGGVKFCTLGARSCQFTTHHKKVEVFQDHIYVAAGRNSAFTFHHAPISALAPEQLDALLQEQHSQAEWVRLLHGLNQAVGEAEQGQDGPDEPSRISVLDAVTPGRKRKVRYENQYSTPSKLKLREDLQESFEDELVVLSSQDSMDQSEDEKLKMVLNQWDLLVNMVNKLGSGLRTLKGTVGEDLFVIKCNFV